MYAATLAAAAKTWDKPEESLEQTNRRIHDGAPVHLLDQRADAYATKILEDFRLGLPSGADILEIGSGTGYIMEAVERRLAKFGTPARSIIGLDIAPSMLRKAKERLGEREPFCYQLYDGVTVPLRDASLDLVYSVAVLQHIPKPFVYNLFFEARRLLRPGGFGLFHLLSFKSLVDGTFPWAREVTAQVRNREDHWHHMYTREEVHAVLRHGTGFSRVDINEENELFVCARK